jgi:hypothetical protein
MKLFNELIVVTYNEEKCKTKINNNITTKTKLPILPILLTQNIRTNSRLYRLSE